MICDLAETYHLFDYRALPPSKVAVLVSGLRDYSRLKMKAQNVRYINPQIIGTVIADNTATLAWLMSSDGEKGRNRPKSLTSWSLNKEDKEKRKVKAFSTYEEFMQARYGGEKWQKD